MLAEIREAMQGSAWRLVPVMTFSHGIGVQVWATKPGSSANARGSKVGPVLFPPDGGTIADTLQMLGSMAVTS